MLGADRKAGREGWFALRIDTLSASYILLFPLLNENLHSEK